jgi:hypothetical protein
MDDYNKNDILQRVLARRRELELEIQKLDVFLSVYKEVSGTEAEAVTAPEPMTGTTVVSVSAVPISHDRNDPMVRPASGIPQKDFNLLVKEIISAQGNPMLPEAIYDEIHRMGRKVGGVKEWDNFRTKLWRAKQFGDLVIIPGAGYWLSDVPNAAVGFIPNVGSIVPESDPATRSSDDGHG